MKNKKYFEYTHLVTFDDTNTFGNVYFSNYFKWQGKYREELIAEQYPEFIDDLNKGFGFATEFAHTDYSNEAFLFDSILIRITISDLSRPRIEFYFEFINKKTNVLLATGKQAVVWVNQQHHPSLMPDKLFESIKDSFNIEIE